MQPMFKNNGQNHNAQPHQNTQTNPSFNTAEPRNGDQPSQLLSAGQWVRAVTGLQAPFGHDGLPTVWG